MLSRSREKKRGAERQERERRGEKFFPLKIFKGNLREAGGTYIYIYIKTSPITVKVNLRGVISLPCG